MSWAGPPERIWCDKDGVFKGVFKEKMELLGVEVDTAPAEAHYQLGQIENAGKNFKYVARRIVDETQLAGREDMKLVTVLATAARNARVKRAGCSAYQWLFGKNPRIPDSLLSDEGRLMARA